jgi:hypothetical protein
VWRIRHLVAVEKAIGILESVVNFPEIAFPTVFVADQCARFVFEWMLEVFGYVLRG